MMSTQNNYAGIDIAKRNFVIGISSLSKTKTETNNPKGIAHTVEYLKKHNVALVVIESTGGLEVPAAQAIHRAGIAVIIANPRQTHQFAQSQPLTKTDAKMLAFFAQMTVQKEGWQTMLLERPSEKHFQTAFQVSIYAAIRTSHLCAAPRCPHSYCDSPRCRSPRPASFVSAFPGRGAYGWIRPDTDSCRRPSQSVCPSAATV